MSEKFDKGHCQVIYQWQIQTFRWGGGGGHPDTEIRGDGLKKKFLALWASVWSKNKGGPNPSPGSHTAYLNLLRNKTTAQMHVNPGKM